MKLPNPPTGKLRGLVRPAFRVSVRAAFSSESSLIVDIVYLYLLRKSTTQRRSRSSLLSGPDDRPFRPDRSG